MPFDICLRSLFVNKYFYNSSCYNNMLNYFYTYTRETSDSCMVIGLKGIASVNYYAAYIFKFPSDQVSGQRNRK